jgi:hypothetical protein
MRSIGAASAYPLATLSASGRHGRPSAHCVFGSIGDPEEDFGGLQVAVTISPRGRLVSLPDDCGTVVPQQFRRNLFG